MDVTTNKDKNGIIVLEMGNVTLALPFAVVSSLHQVVKNHLGGSGEAERQALKKKIMAYRALASKMIDVDDLIIQKFTVELKPEHLVTLVRLARGDELYRKVLKNLSKGRGKQFKADYKGFNKVTEHQACIYMEMIVPCIKKAAQERKKIIADL